MAKLIIKNGRIVTENRIIGGSLYIKDGLIASLGEDPGGFGQAEEWDAGGLYVSPGFIDIHNHGRLGRNVADGSGESLGVIAKGQLAQGVTAFLAGPSTLPWEQYLEVIRICAAYCQGEQENRAQCLGLYLEGVFFSREKRGAHLENLLRPPAEEDVAAVLEAGGGHIRVFCIAPELPGALDAVRKIRKGGVAVSAAHSNADFDEALRGINAGISLSTHTFNGMPSLDHHHPSLLNAVLGDDRVTCELIADGIHLHPSVLQLALKAKGPDRIALVSDSVAFNGMPEGKYPYRNQYALVKAGEIRLEDGRLAGSCLNLNRAVRNMVRLAGASLCEAVRTASLVPARIIGAERRKGSIAVGKDADLVVFDEDVAVKAVFLKGGLAGEGTSKGVH
jgi:N-acetylglucosamine-6-phosphate deacetylase